MYFNTFLIQLKQTTRGLNNICPIHPCVAQVGLGNDQIPPIRLHSDVGRFGGDDVVHKLGLRI